MNLEEIIKILRAAFERDDVKRAVLDTERYTLNIQTAIHSTGFCFTASEVIFRLTGGKENWNIKRIVDPKDWNNGTHYFLVNKQNKDIY